MAVPVAATAATAAADRTAIRRPGKRVSSLRRDGGRTTRPADLAGPPRASPGARGVMRAGASDMRPGSEPVSKPPAPPGHRLAAPDRHRRACKGVQPELRPAAAPGTTIRRPGGTDRFRDGFLERPAVAARALLRARAVLARALDRAPQHRLGDDLDRVAALGQAAQIDRRGDAVALARFDAAVVDVDACGVERVAAGLLEADRERALAQALLRALAGQLHDARQLRRAGGQRRDEVGVGAALVDVGRRAVGGDLGLDVGRLGLAEADAQEALAVGLEEHAVGRVAAFRDLRAVRVAVPLVLAEVLAVGLGADVEPHLLADRVRARGEPGLAH